MKIFSTKNIGREKDDTIPLEHPKKDPMIEKMMKKEFECHHKSIEQPFHTGIFAAARSYFKAPLEKVGFVQIVAATRMSKPNTEHKLIDGSKRTNWISSKKKHPFISFYFPYHLITLTCINIRSHCEYNLGERFLREFHIEGMDDERKWTTVSHYDICNLATYGAKDYFSTKKHEPFRIIRIVCNNSCTVNFGISEIEIFGEAHYNPSPIAVSKNTLRDLSNSNCDYTVEKDYKRSFIPNESFKTALFKKDKFWKDDTDDDEDEEEKKYNFFEFIIEAHDKNGPSLITKYEEITKDKISIFNPQYIGLVSSKENNPVDLDTSFTIDFNYLSVDVDQIKITTNSDIESLPNELIIGAIDVKYADENEPWSYITHISKDNINSDSEICFELPKDKRYTGLIIT